MKIRNKGTRRGGTLFGLVPIVLLTACGDLLTVDNPGAVTEDDLDDPDRIPLMVQGVVGEFQPAHTWHTLYTGTFTDELTDVHTFHENRPIDLRLTSPAIGLLNTLYVRMQRARAAGDETAGRIRELLGPEAETHTGLATSLAYSGYALTHLGEAYCEAPIDVSRAYSPDELFGMALDRFEDAISVASAAGADEMNFLAHVGAARAALQRGETQLAAEYARQVPTDFELWSHHSENAAIENNVFWDATRSPNEHVMLSPAFQGLNDLRIPEPEEPLPMMGAFEGPVVHQPYGFSGWEPGELNLPSRSSNVRLASGLEARYIVAEVEGPTAETLDLVNERRAVGGHDAVDLSGDALMAELRDQRRRDFYLTGHRLGDLRRYLEQGHDYFPSGTWPFSEQEYGTDTCLPIPQSELNSNPNL